MTLSSRRGIPDEILSSETSCFKAREVIGKMDIPFSPIRKGNSFVPCVEPRYLTMRNRRVETWLATR